MKLAIALTALVTVSGCGGGSGTAKAVKAAPENPQAAKRHPLAKYVELAGFRVSEPRPGEIHVRFVAINHSDADMGELTLRVRLRTTAAKPDDPPLGEFESKIQLGPGQIREAQASMPTTLRAYELPDWQFLRVEFDIVHPPAE